MNQWIKWATCFGISCWFSVEAQSPRQIYYPTRVKPRSFAELSAPAPGHWYGRIVKPKEKVIETYDIYHTRTNRKEYDAQLVLILTEPLPVNYQPGSLYASLPDPKSGHWRITDNVAKTGTTKVWDQTYILNSSGQKEEVSFFLLEEPTAPVLPKTEPRVDLEPLSTPAIPPPPFPAEHTHPMNSEQIQKPSAKAQSSKIYSKPSNDTTGRFPRGSRPIVGESLDAEPSKPTLVDKIAEEEPNLVTPEPLISKTPLALKEIDWSNEERISKKTETDAAQLAQHISSQSRRWQVDLSKRFLTCTDGKCLVRDQGTEHTEVPFQIGLGRIWLLSLESERLAYELENHRLSSAEVAARTVRLVRRLESLQGHLDLSSQETKSNYGTKLKEKLRDLKKLSEAWNAYETPERKRWVLRWQLAIEDVSAMQERVERLEKLPDFLLPPSVTGAVERLSQSLSQRGKYPWLLRKNEQRDLADEISVEVSKLRDDYTQLALLADSLRSKPQEHVDMLVILGAIENLSVYSWTIYSELSDAP